MNLRKKSRFFATVTWILLLSLLFSMSIIADETVNTDVPADSGEIVPPTFPDVEPTDWFYDDVTSLTSLGIISGYPDGLFKPENEITNAEFVKILMVSIHADVSNELDLLLFPGHWATQYISYAYKYGIITDDEIIHGFDPSAPISRASMTKMMILALGIEPARIDDPFSDISDIYASTAYKEYLLRGYLLDNGTRIYNGAGNALRSEACAIIMRILNYRENPYEYKKEQILAGAAESALNTESELIDLFYILNREFIEEFTFTTTVPFEVWEGYYRHANLIYLEYFYTASLECSFDPVNAPNVYNVKLTFNGNTEDYKQIHSKTTEKADAIIAAIITEDMSERDKIKAIHDYLILNCAYDYNNYVMGTVQPRSRLAIGVFEDKLSVCQGYTAAFNLLCREVGIRSVVIKGTSPSSTDEHAWNLVLVDGRLYHIDVTHDDPVPDTKGKVSYRYFMLTDAEMTALGYSWDKSQANLKYFY